jgi:ankyrin repeat protein
MSLFPAHDAARDGDLSRLRALLEQNRGLVNVRCNYHYTPLDRAAECGHTEVIELLHKLGAEVNAGNNAGYTPLHHAARYYGRTEVIELLHKLGAEVNAGNNDGLTPLHYAASCRQTKAAKLLGELGADPEARQDAS